MKKQPLWRSYLSGISDKTTGESYRSILHYFVPELVTAFLLCSVLNVIDASFIGHLKSTSMYATQGVTSVFIYFLTKIAEGFSIGTVVLCGQYNGLQNYKHVGRAAMTSLLITTMVGAVISGFLFFFPHVIYNFFQVPDEMVEMGVAFLRVRAIGIFFSFLYFALIGFLRGIKRPGLSMQFFLLGGIVFVFFDYALIFGKFGFPALELQGSAIASVIQYGVMLVAVLSYIIWDKSTRMYSLSIVRGFDREAARDIMRLSWPVMLDKATLAAAKIWLVRLIAPMGKTALASFAVIKDMEQFAFVPAMAFAQVVTFLISNDYAAGNWLAIKNNIKKVIFLSSVMVSSILLLFALWPHTIIQFFDQKGTFTLFAAAAFPLLGVLVVFDLLQCLLAGALRGAANVKTVMWTRLFVCIYVFGPLSYVFSIAPISNFVLKFVLVFGSYYVSNGVMTAIYVYRFRRDAWKHQSTIKKSKESDGQDYIPRDRTPDKDITYQDGA